MAERDSTEQVMCVLAAGLEGSGWEVVRLEEQARVLADVDVDLSVWVRSGEHEVRLAVELMGTRGLGDLRERVALLRHVLPDAWGADAAVAVFALRVTPPMASALRELRVGYLDAYGRAFLRWPGLFIDRPGSDIPLVDLPETRRRNGGAGRETLIGAAEVFGPRPVKRHRVLRALLSYPGRSWHQTELAEEADVSVYTAHVVVGFLVREHYAEERGAGPNKTVRLTGAGDVPVTWGQYWVESWRADMRRSATYFSLAPDTEEIKQSLAIAAAGSGMELGFTLTAGADFFGAYLRDEQVHAWVTGDAEEIAREAGLEPVGRGANVVLLPARDEGLLYLPETVLRRHGIDGSDPGRPVSPVQLYLDMAAAGGRYAEQARVLLEEALGYGP